MRKMMTLGLQTRKSRGYGFWKGGKEVFECKNVPPFVIRIFWCRDGSPRRANLHFFLRGTLTMSPPSLWFSVLLNLNLLKLELGVDYLFLKQTNSKRKLWIQRIRGCLAATFSACLEQRRGNDQLIVTSSPLASIPKYLQVINNQVWPILTASLSYLDWFLLSTFGPHPGR